MPTTAVARPKAKLQGNLQWIAVAVGKRPSALLLPHRLTSKVSSQGLADLMLLLATCSRVDVEHNLLDCYHLARLDVFLLHYSAKTSST